MSSPNQRNHELVMLYKSVTSLYSAKEFETVITKVQGLVDQASFTHEQLDPFLYYMAAALDNSGRTTDALPIFVELLGRQNSNTALAQSVKITGRCMERLASELFHKRPESKELENFESVLMILSSAPLWLRMHIAKRRLRAGDSAYARNLCESYLALSPNDGDYLRWAFEIAKLGSDAEWEKQLKAHVAALIKRHPYRLDLLILAADSQSNQHAA